MKKLVILLALITGSLVAASVAAASPSSMLSVSPFSPVVGDSLTWAGCGYTSGQMVEVQTVFNSKTATVIYQIDETADPNGCFNTNDAPGLSALYAGKWTTNVYPFNPNGSLGKKVATMVFSVTG